MFHVDAYFVVFGSMDFTYVNDIFMANLNL